MLFNITLLRGKHHFYDFHMLIGTIDLFSVDKFYQMLVQGTCFAFFYLTCPLLLLNLRTGYGQTGSSMVIHKNSYHVTLGIDCSYF